MNKRIAMKLLKRYFICYGTHANETKEHCIREAVYSKERYLKPFIKWVYKKYGEGDISKNRFVLGTETEPDIYL